MGDIVIYGKPTLFGSLLRTLMTPAVAVEKADYKRMDINGYLPLPVAPATVVGHEATLANIAGPVTSRPKETIRGRSDLA